MNRKMQLLVFALFLTVQFFITQRSAEAVSFNFSVINPANSSAANLADLSFSVDVTSGIGSTVVFDFTNNSSISSVITQIYFDDDLALLVGGSQLSAVGTVDFTIGDPGPGNNNLPGGNNVSFNATETLNARANNPAPTFGINPAEALRLSYLGNYQLAIDALVAGSLRIGLHVQSIGTASTSDAFVNSPRPFTAIPEPGTILLLGSALGASALRRRYRKG